MIEIKDLLGRFQLLLLSEESKAESVRRVISEAINLDIKKEEVKIKNNIIYLDIKPIYKSEVFIKQEKIYQKLSEIFNGRAPDSIR